MVSSRRLRLCEQRAMNEDSQRLHELESNVGEV